MLLRREQYRRTDDPDGCAAIVRSLVIGKALNQRAVIRRALRDHGERMDAPAAGTLEVAERRLTDIARRAERPQSADALRGLEGEAANVYFGVFDALILAEGDEFRFTGRSRRPPLDPVNALLSFVYALLVHDVRSALETTGLDPAVGFLHRDRPGRPSLALDLMEEFRPFFADRLVLSLINRRQVSGKGFRRLENGACLMTDELRKDRAGRLSGAQARGAAPSVPRRADHRRPALASAGAAAGPPSARRPRRLPAVRLEIDR